MLFLTRRRRRKLLAEPFPDRWMMHLRRNVHYYELLDDAERARLRDDLRIFIAEKRWEGCGGLELTEEMQVTIAAQAVLLVLASSIDDLRRAKDILVYPAAYVMPSPRRVSGAIMAESTAASGTAWYRGPVIISWADALAGGRNAADGRNVVLHEFAHKLDMLDGVVNGTPPLKNRDAYRDWHRVMTVEYDELQRDSLNGRATLLRTYAATNPGEFFAVATECFFEKPTAMRDHHPDLYRVLSEYYQQDTAARFERADRGWL
jgi:Mlc titration factor MtfA (ptsG expression regulator)